MIDIDTPAPGPWRMPRDSERRCRVYFQRPHHDCIDVCEVNPDLEEATDATMRVIAAAPDLLAAAREALAFLADHPAPGADAAIAALRAAIGRTQRGGGRRAA